MRGGDLVPYRCSIYHREALKLVINKWDRKRKQQDGDSASKQTGVLLWWNIRHTRFPLAYLPPKDSIKRNSLSVWRRDLEDVPWSQSRDVVTQYPYCTGLFYFSQSWKGEWEVLEKYFHPLLCSWALKDIDWDLTLNPVWHLSVKGCGTP